MFNTIRQSRVYLRGMFDMLAIISMLLNFVFVYHCGPQISVLTAPDTLAIDDVLEGGGR